MSDEIIYSDRYTTLGITPNGCDGQCEGTGVVPIYMGIGDQRRNDPNLGYCADEDDPLWIEAWQQAEAASPAEDGWHFVRCPRCSAAS